MKARTKKWVHTGVITLVGVMTDIGAQLAAGNFNPTRAAIVGVIVGGAARVVGAVLASVSTDPVPPTDAGK